MAVRHPPAPLNAVGLTQASSVIFVTSSEAASGTITRLLVPLKDRAPPNFPAVQLAFTSEPALPFPEASPAIVPLPSSKPYAATRPAGGEQAPCSCAKVGSSSTG